MLFYYHCFTFGYCRDARRRQKRSYVWMHTPVFSLSRPTLGPYFAQIVCSGADWPVSQHSRQTHGRGTVPPQLLWSWQLPSGPTARVLLPRQPWLWPTVHALRPRALLAATGSSRNLSAGSLSNVKGQHWASQVAVTCWKGIHSAPPLGLWEDWDPKAELSVVIGKWYQLIQSLLSVPAGMCC